MFLFNGNIWVYTLLSVVIVSLISLVGVMAISIKKNALNKMLILLVSLSAGVMIGDAFLHLIPEAAANGFTTQTALLILMGITFFFILEKFIHWKHCHLHPSHNHKPSYVIMNLVGDAVHNFIDGLLIAGSFLVDIRLGFATTFAVILHEIPQEIGDFGVLLHGGFSKSKAILFNLVTATFAILGAIVGLLLSSVIRFLPEYLIPLTAGGFIYIAASDLIPQIHQHKDKRMSQSFLELLIFVLGILMMYGLLFLE
ncbi:ZIP family metal transporter [Candidatus Woesearchaeota archaeon]|nr:ZIP family metal transporter [Candidatus Woesearchaeota archaeon]